MPQPVTVAVTFDGRTFDYTPCSKKHAAYFEAGYLVPSCRKCAIIRNGADTRTADVNAGGTA